MDNKEIRFIDSHYNELFRIPDGGQIMITTPDGGKIRANCKYIDEYHTDIDGRCYHICQWAELNEQNGRTYAPAEPPLYKLENITPEEFEFMYAKEDESIDRGCIGHLRADFDTGKSFFSTWWPENDSLKTQEFKDEFNKVINYFRKESETPILKSRSDMYNNCFNLKPTRSATDKEVSGFKVVTEKHTYYLRCKPRLGEYNLYAYCYNTQALDKFRNTRFVEQNFDAVNQDKFFKTDYGFEEIYYNPDSTAGGQLVYNEFSFELIREASKQDTMMKFYNYLNSGCKQYCVDIDSAEFMDYLKDFMEREPDYLKDNKETANAMIKAANEDKKRNKTEPER